MRTIGVIIFPRHLIQSDHGFEAPGFSTARLYLPKCGGEVAGLVHTECSLVQDMIPFVWGFDPNQELSTTQPPTLTPCHPAVGWGGELEKGKARRVEIRTI